MSILSGYKRFKKYLRTGEDYKLCSEWTKSDSVEMTDGSTLQESMETVVCDMESTQNDITDMRNELKTSLGGMTFGVDAAGRYGYIKAGADTVTPFKDISAIMSDVVFTCQTIPNIIYNSKGTALTQVNYKVPNDGMLKIICRSTHYRYANWDVASGNKQWHVVKINDKTVLNIPNINDILTFDVMKDDIVTFEYYVQWTSGDALYSYVTASLATLLYKK